MAVERAAVRITDRSQNSAATTAATAEPPILSREQRRRVKALTEARKILESGTAVSRTAPKAGDVLKVAQFILSGTVSSR